jgi:hypothetical protein
VLQRVAELQRRIAKGLGDSAGAVVTGGGQAHVQAEVVAEGQRLAGDWQQGQAGQGEA